MYDKEFLLFIYTRLVTQHSESTSVDYMQKFRSIIDATNPTQCTPNTPCKHNWVTLTQELGVCKKCLNVKDIKNVNKAKG